MVNAKEAFDGVLAEVKKHISGNDEVIELLFTAMVANGNVLLEGVPGLAKTTTTKALADAVDADFGRVQGTADLKISDIIGYAYFDDTTKSIQLKKGPIFTNILLVDEFNRTPPMVTTSMLEALEEKQVTIGNTTLPLPKPFIAFATQNPLNIEGTIPLPKVLTDRFVMRVAFNYATEDQEVDMIRIKEKEEYVKPQRVITKEDVLELQEQAKHITLPDDVVRYMVRVVEATRKDIHVVMGGSPRAEISFMRCVKARALIHGKKEGGMDDVKALARAVLSHRIVVKSTGGLGVNGIIDGIIATLT